MEALPIRKNIRLKGYDYSATGAYFVTICVKDGHELLGAVVVGDAVHSVPHVALSQYGKVVRDILENGGDFCIHLDCYIIMPNHIHMILTVLHDERDAKKYTGRDAVDSVPYKSLISTFVRSLKTMTTKKIGFSLWQRSFHDRIIRDEEEYQRIRRYIDENPARWTEDEYFAK